MTSSSPPIGRSLIDPIRSALGMVPSSSSPVCLLCCGGSKTTKAATISSPNDTNAAPLAASGLEQRLGMDCLKRIFEYLIPAELDDDLQTCHDQLPTLWPARLAVWLQHCSACLRGDVAAALRPNAHTAPHLAPRHYKVRLDDNERGRSREPPALSGEGMRYLSPVTSLFASCAKRPTRVVSLDDSPLVLLKLALVCRRWNVAVAQHGVYFSRFARLFPVDVLAICSGHRKNEDSSKEVACGKEASLSNAQQEEVLKIEEDPFLSLLSEDSSDFITAGELPWRTHLAGMLQRRFRHVYTTQELTGLKEGAEAVRTFLQQSRPPVEGRWNMLVAMLRPPKHMPEWEHGRGQQIMVSGPHQHLVDSFTKCVAAATIMGETLPVAPTATPTGTTTAAATPPAVLCAGCIPFPGEAHPSDMMIHRYFATIDGSRVCLNVRHVYSAVNRWNTVTARNFFRSADDSLMRVDKDDEKEKLSLLPPQGPPKPLPLDLVGVVTDMHGTSLDNIFEAGLRGAVFIIDASAACFHAMSSFSSSRQQRSAEGRTSSNLPSGEPGAASSSSPSTLPAASGNTLDAASASLSDTMQALCFLLGQRVMHHGVPAVVLLLQTEYLSSEHVARIVTIVRDTLTDRAARLAQRGEGQDSVVSICTASLLVPQSLVRSLLFFNHVLQ